MSITTKKPNPTRPAISGYTRAPRQTLPAFRLVQSSRTIRRLANFVLAMLILTIAAMAFLPWQQSAKGTGKVVAFVPQERQQTVTSQVKGVVSRISDACVEGSWVERGDFIMEIQPNAANLVEQLTAQMNDLGTKLATANAKADVYQQNIVDLDAARDFTIMAAEELVESAESKYAAKQQAIAGYAAKELQARLNYERQRTLFEKGLKPEKEIEKLKKDWDFSRAELESAQSEATAAERELDAKRHELEQKSREAKTKVDYSRAMLADARGQAATVQKEIRDLEIKLAELDRLTITAPRSGNIFRMPITERGQQVKEGSVLFTIVPDTSQRAVELWVSGNDISLIRRGDHVRLQFEGWPAVQFAGWPSVAVGTFGGQVATIDPTDDGTGQFRVLVKPSAGEDWPEERYLRQGVRANGWVMLRQVSLGYEIWRQLNGFPPAVSKDPPKGTDDKPKSKVKLPK